MDFTFCVQAGACTVRRKIVHGIHKVIYRFLPPAGVLPIALLFGGCATDNASAQPARTAATSRSTDKIVPSTNVSRVQAWKDAELVASMSEGRSSAAGSGGSMQPVFGDNTMIVISKIAYEELKPGMTVAYMNRRGHQVVHQILEKDVHGWRVQGLNNETEDLDHVTRENLLGVIYASFAAEEP
jgi:hypothetical protein